MRRPNEQQHQMHGFEPILLSQVSQQLQSFPCCLCLVWICLSRCSCSCSNTHLEMAHIALFHRIFCQCSGRALMARELDICLSWRLPSSRPNHCHRSAGGTMIRKGSCSPMANLWRLHARFHWHQSKCIDTRVLKVFLDHRTLHSSTMAHSSTVMMTHCLLSWWPW